MIKFFQIGLKEDFYPLLYRQYNKPYIYFDNAATSFTPIYVADIIHQYYVKYSLSISRGSYYNSIIMDNLYRQTRLHMSKLINIYNNNNLVFTKGTTDSINTIANSFILQHISSKNEILITILEHHANVIPWQEICKKKNLFLRIVYLKKNLNINWKEFIVKINNKTKFIAITHISNVIGKINSITNIIFWAHKKGIFVLIDGAQAVSCLKINLFLINPDFYVFSMHKMFGPTGIGFLYIIPYLSRSFTHNQTGGGIIKTVSINKTDFLNIPIKLEPGTPNVASILGIRGAISYIKKMNIYNIFKQDRISYFVKYVAQKNNRMKIVGGKSKNIMAFIFKNIHSHDISTILNYCEIAIRSGFLCAEPLIKYLNLKAVTRLSYSFYNTVEEAIYLMKILKKIIWIFK